MNEIDVFELADRTLAEVVTRIRDDQWDTVMPADFATSADKTATPTLLEVISYHAYDDAWVPDMLAGRTMAEVGVDAFRGDLLGDSPVTAFSAIVDTAVAASRSVSDLDATAHCSFGDFTIRDYLHQANFFRGLRSHDIAQVIEADVTLPPALVQGLWDELSPSAEEWRAMGVFPPEVPVPADAPLLDRLLGLTGRPVDKVRG